MCQTLVRRRGVVKCDIAALMHDLHLTTGEVKFLVTGKLKSTVLENGAGRKG